MRKVEGDEEAIKYKTEILNTDAAEFGEEYRSEVLGDTTYLAKIAKLEHLLPLDRINHLEKVVQQFSGSINSEQADVFQKHYETMKKTGKISDEVSDTFGIERGMKL